MEVSGPQSWRIQVQFRNREVKRLALTSKGVVESFSFSDFCAADNCDGEVSRRGI